MSDAMLEVQIENYSQGRILLQRDERDKRKAAALPPNLEAPETHPHEHSHTAEQVPPPERTEEQRFWSKVNKTESCWLWTAGLSKGYGQAQFRKKNCPAHRVAWLLLKGPIPEGMTLDHVKERCRNKNCVNPAHLEIVTIKENVLRGDGVTAINARKLFCKRGHEFTTANIKQRRLGKSCRECDKYHESRRPARPGH